MLTPRHGLGVAKASNGKIYAIGGKNGSTYLATVEEYDPATDTWTPRTSLPSPRYRAAVAAASNGKVYAMGGRVPRPAGGEYVLATVFEYDPVADSWTPRADMPNAGSGARAAGATNGKVYFVRGGGLGTYEYDPGADAWATRADPPTGRNDFAVATASNGRVYAVGGSIGPTLATVEEFDPPSNTWASLAPLPTARWGLAAAVATNGRLYAMGGGATSGLTNIVGTLESAAVRPVAGPFAYVTTGGLDGAVTVVDTSTHTVVDTIPVGVNPALLAITPDGTRAYVPNRGTNQSPGTTVSVVDTDPISSTYRTVIGTVSGFSKPVQVAITPDGTRAYVVNLGAKRIDMIDLATNNLVATIGVVNNGASSIPRSIGISADGRRAYVTHIPQSTFGSNLVLVIDIVPGTPTYNTVISVISNLGPEPRQFASSPDGKRVYVTIGGAVGGAVSVIDTLTDTKIAGPITLYPAMTFGSGPRGIAMLPDGSRAYIANGNIHTVTVLDTDPDSGTYHQVLGTTVGDGQSPTDLAITPDGTRVYVTVTGHQLPLIHRQERSGTSLAPDVKRAKMVGTNEKPSPTRCSHYEARSSAFPVRGGEDIDGDDGPWGTASVPGVGASGGPIQIDRATREAS